MLIPEDMVLRASKWCYSGVWSFFTRWLLVPEHPPTLQGADDQGINSFRPCQGFLKYMKLFFWIGAIAFDVALLIGWIALLVAVPWLALILLPLTLIVMILPDVAAYIAIHLRYDTTWYVLSDRSMRIRRGIWIIHETTITYDNIQNVSIRQGPLQRYFGFSDITVETAGGGSGGPEGGASAGHNGLLEGIGNAEELRALILAKWQESKSAGLGDEATSSPREKQTRQAGTGFTAEQFALLSEIRDLSLAAAKAE